MRQPYFPSGIRYHRRQNLSRTVNKWDILVSIMSGFFNGKTLNHRTDDGYFSKLIIKRWTVVGERRGNCRGRKGGKCPNYDSVEAKNVGYFR